MQDIPRARRHRTIARCLAGRQSRETRCRVTKRRAHRNITYAVCGVAQRTLFETTKGELTRGASLRLRTGRTSVPMRPVGLKCGHSRSVAGAGPLHFRLAPDKWVLKTPDEFRVRLRQFFKRAADLKAGRFAVEVARRQADRFAPRAQRCVGGSRIAASCAGQSRQGTDLRP